MGKLSDLVRRDYDDEVTIISEAGGRLWPKWTGLAIGMAVLWTLALVFGDPWSNRDIGGGIVFLIGWPFVERYWERYKVAARMRHEREVRMEMKLNALLGLVNIKDEELFE
jgi:hypothetical protein